MTEVLLRIGELAAKAGVSPRTVDYYTNLGLISPAKRTAGNYRLYHPTDVDRIHLVQRLEVQGVPLEEISTALTTRQADVTAILDLINTDLRTLQAAAENASPEVHGLLAAIAARVHSLITVALQIPPDLLVP
ncbi:MerR family transcriptional regulator [Saccharothrix syringae]|uniref:MerR family transcriptional regulator n=1 Tax=Saccharothrix syringae TaxID=103733 RepID=A0A5Q0GWT3_SACSY|nr:MerR family transcriptional regulator [Saccharothrix syringae]QFZ18439.1 MerR family transcriptional regulator [Saccharothrix syringae]